MAEQDDALPLVLVVGKDKSPGEARVMQEALREANTEIHLRVASDGVEAMAFLRKQELQRDGPTHPDLIVMDLDLPKTGGLAKDHGPEIIPTVILTGSPGETDLAKSEKVQAKPLEPRVLETLIKSIDSHRLEKKPTSQ
jgi:chemotaxis family two-component system response regulator Rcp1